MLHELLAGINVAKDREWAEAVCEGEIVQGRGVLLKLAPSILGVPHNLNNLNPYCFIICLY
jgi:hypothetical protein